MPPPCVPACAAVMQPQRAAAPDWPFKAQGTQLIGAVSSIDFCSAAPHDYLVSAGTRLQLYNGANSVAKRQFTRFKDRAYGGSFRRDGRLIVAGCEDSVVQVGAWRGQGRGGGGAWLLHCIALHIRLAPPLAAAPRSAANYVFFCSKLTPQHPPPLLPPLPRRCLTLAAARCCGSSRAATKPPCMWQSLRQTSSTC